MNIEFFVYIYPIKIEKPPETGEQFKEAGFRHLVTEKRVSPRPMLVTCPSKIRVGEYDVASDAGTKY